MNMNDVDGMDPRLPPVVIDRDELAYFHAWQPFGANWWSTVIGTAIAASSLTVLALLYFGRLA